MADLLQLASQFIAAQRTAFMAQAVTLRRGVATTPVNATIGKTVFQVDPGDGVITEWESRDYLITAADYQFSDAPASPTTGDQVLEADPAGAWIYELMAPAGEQLWRWSDRYRITIRIHTKYVGRAAP